MNSRIFRTITFFSFIFIGVSAMCQEKLIKYYDADWKLCEKSKALYYREIYYQAARKPTSIVRDYYLNGKLQWEGKLISEDPDVLDSICTWYDDKGRISEQRTYKSGQLNGLWTNYYQDGSIMQKKMYEDGMLDGLSVSYYPNGILHTRSVYKKGKQEGESLEFHDNGKLEHYRFFLEDTIRGPAIRYDTSGQRITLYIPYNNKGQIDGNWLTYYDNGNRRKEIYKMGKNVGPDTIWHKNGVIESVTVYSGEGKYFKRIHYDTNAVVLNEDTNIEYPDTVTLQVAKDNINCLYGLKNYKKEWVIKPVYTFITDGSGHFPFEPYFKIVHNGKQGIISLDGSFIIPAEYDEIRLLEETRKAGKNGTLMDNTGFFAFKTGNQCGLISRLSGKITFKAEVDRIYPFSNGLFRIVKGGVSGLADSSKILLQPAYENLQDVFRGEYFSFTISGHDGQPEAPIAEAPPATETELPAVAPPQMEMARAWPGAEKGQDSILLDQKWVKADIKTDDIMMGIINIKGDTIAPPVHSGYRIYPFNDRAGLIWAFDWTYYEEKLWGVYTVDGELVLPVAYHFGMDPPDFRTSRVIVLTKKNLRYFVEPDGSITILNDTTIKQISALESFNDLFNSGKASAYFMKNGKYGLMDAKGNIILNAKYEYLRPSRFTGSESTYNSFIYHYIVKENGKYGIVTERDSVVLPLEYEWIYPRDGKLYVIRNKFLKVLSSFDYKENTYYSQNHNNERYANGLIRFCLDACGIVNDSGRVLLDPVYAIEKFINNKAYFSNGVSNGYIHEDGRIIWTEERKYAIGTYKDGYAWVISSSGKMGIMDREENLVIDTVHDVISDFDPVSQTCWVQTYMPLDSSEGYWDVVEYSNWGLVNNKGQYLLDSIFYRPCASANSFNIVLDSSSRWGLVSRSGGMVIPCIYDDIRQQGNGLYLIARDGKWGLADSAGNIRVQPVWDDVTSFVGNYAVFIRDSTHLGLVNSRGEMLHDVEKVYNASGGCLADTLNFFERKEDEELYWEGWEELKVDVEGYQMTDSLVDTKKQNMLRNRITLMATANLFQENANDRRNDYADIHFDMEKFGELPWGFEGASEGTNYYVKVMAVNQRSFSLNEVHENYYSPPRGMGYASYNYDFQNYAYAKDSVYRIYLRQLFIKGYEAVLNRAIIKGMKEIDDPDIDCTNPEQYLNRLENSFAITLAGIVFYLSAEDREDEENYVELLIPYSAIKSIINKKSVLGEFLK